ncbi:GntR family transcriptional regulator [Jiangella mangrovi]|uniref:DNA-binding LacI/PurR family transcriptional regulator n=1 Tax=Jiangella mangrovi TaxID=1524084 RepID=A0A7W9GRJ8_9ACTN|nr:GntR family transcriptional regulator [Jiangella mangrovi]MBB5788572.1 DNA-binding LacI/PurR family transcriptional regulator [Jiangella mangrovi]
MNEHGGLGMVPRGAKSRELAARLRRGITDGRWALGARLPTEPELATTYDVGVNTVRRAIAVLVDEGLVRRRQGSGTFVEAVPGPGRSTGRFLDGSARARIGRVGVVVPSSAYYYPPVIDGAGRELAAADLRMMLACSDYDPELELAEARRLVEAGVDGLLVVPTLFEVADPAAYLAELRGLGVPVVLMERRLAAPAPDDATEYVCSNILGGAYAAVRHLASLGRTRLGHLGPVRTATSEAVAEGFAAAVADLGLEAVPGAVVRRATWAAGDLAAYARACAENRIDGVLAHGDREAAALLGHLRAAGLTVPADVAVISHDDEVADVAEIPLTAVNPPKTEIGRLAAAALLRRIADGPAAPPIQIQLQPTLTVRESCGARAASSPAAADAVATG